MSLVISCRRHARQRYNHRIRLCTCVTVVQSSGNRMPFRKPEYRVRGKWIQFVQRRAATGPWRVFELRYIFGRVCQCTAYGSHWKESSVAAGCRFAGDVGCRPQQWIRCISTLRSRIMLHGEQVEFEYSPLLRISYDQ